MKSVAKKVLLFAYLAIVVALLADYLMGLGWFHGYDKAVTLLLVPMAWAALWLKSRAESKARGGEVGVEALDSEGAVHSDPGTRRFVQQTFAIGIGMVALVCLATGYRDRGQGRPVDVFVLLTMTVIFAWVFWKRFGNIGQVESDDGVTLTLSRRGETMRVPWSQVESVDVSRPYAFWQVMITFRRLGESKAEAVRFLPLGWRHMTPAAAERLKAALEARRMSQ